MMETTSFGRTSMAMTIDELAEELLGEDNANEIRALLEDGNEEGAWHYCLGVVLYLSDQKLLSGEKYLEFCEILHFTPKDVLHIRAVTLEKSPPLIS